MSSIRPQGERIASLEVRMQIIEEQYTAIDGKLDTLIDLKNKGAGAFWLICSFLGTSLLAGVSYIVSIFKHH